MVSNSSLQPWFDYSLAISGPLGYNDVFTALPPIQPCYGGSIGGENVNCSVVCQDSYMLFDPQHPENLATCGMWATMGATLERSGQSPAKTPFDAVGLNVSAIETLETVGGGHTSINTQVQTSLVNCFASFYAATHSLTNDIESVPKTCSPTAGFQFASGVEPCFEVLCAPRTLDADLGGIGVCSGRWSFAAIGY